MSQLRPHPPIVGDGTFGAPGPSVLFGVGDGTFQPAQTVSTGNYAQTIALGDLNGDGIPDLVTAGGFTGLLSVQFGRGDGTFKAPQRYSSSGGDDGFATATSTWFSAPEELRLRCI